MNAWWMALRPKTLSAAIIPVVAATALVMALGQPVQWWISFCALMGALLIQVGTNLVNDAVDFRKGADREDRLGPRRVTQSGLLSARTVMWGGFVCFVLAVFFGVPLVIHGGWVIVTIGLLSVLFGYLYTAGPFPLAYVGLGDLFVVLFFGLVAVGGVYYLHSGGFNSEALILGLQIGFLSTVLIAINNLRDVVQDATANKKTLAVRFGRRFVQWEILCLWIFTFSLNFYWWQQGKTWAALLPLTTLPVAIPVVKGIFKTEPGPHFNGYLARASLVQMLFGFLLATGFLLQ